MIADTVTALTVYGVISCLAALTFWLLWNDK